MTTNTLLKLGIGAITHPGGEPMHRILTLFFFIFILLGSRSALCEQPQYLNLSQTLPAGLPFSEAVRVGDTLYLSGQLGVEPGTLNLVPGGIDAEAGQTMRNIKADKKSLHWIGEYKETG